MTSRRSRTTTREARELRPQGWLGDTRPEAPFWILSALLIIAFFTGGDARGSAPFLFILRPAAIMVAAYGLMTMGPAHWRKYRYPLGMAGAIIALTVVHLIPMPPMIWQGLPRHGLVRMIDNSIGMPDLWRPLSLVPSETLNALYALSVPLAVIAIAVQLRASDRVRILYVLLALSGISMVVGLLQATGVPINLYYATDGSSPVQAAGLFANRNHQAALLAAMLPMLAVACRLGSGRFIMVRPVIASAIGCALLIVPLLIVTGSRAGLALGVISIFITLFYGLLPVGARGRLSTRAAISAKIAAGVMVLGVSALVTFLSARGLAFTRLQNIDSDVRPEAWATTLRLIPEYLPWGSGIGSFVDVYVMHEPLEQVRETYFNHAHNEYLEIALTAGIPGLLLLLAAAFWCGRALWKNRRGDSSAEVFARLGGALVIVFACASVPDYPLRTPLVAAIFALAVTWLAGVVPNAQQESQPSFPTPETDSGASIHHELS